MNNLKKAVFLDRDGTIAEDVHYCSRVEDFKILPSAPQAIRLLKKHGFTVILITNQSGIARGYFTGEMLSLIHQKMQDDLELYDAQLDAIYFCPHHPDEGCACRKPKPALILQAAKEMGIDLPSSYMVGDHDRDIEAGRAAGCRTLLVTTGPDQGKSNIQNKPPEHVADSLYEAAKWIIGDTEKRSRRR